MIASSDLIKLWSELAQDNREGVQQVRRRIAPDAAVDIFAFHSAFDSSPGLFVGATMQSQPSIVAFTPCRGITIKAEVSRTAGIYHSSLSIVLEDPALLGVFAVLCADLVAAIAPMRDVETAFIQGRNRLERWLVMFDRMPSGGLSRERRLGLFGELHVLSVLMEMMPPDRAAAAWHGWDAQHQDFKLGGLGLEVKTSSAKRHARIRISNEKQLDEKPWTNLVLAYVQVDENIPEGQTLPDIVELVRDGLVECPAARHELDLHLLEGGYTDAQAQLYSQEPYVVRKMTFFKVRDHFPRLTDDHLPAGVGDITYTILASDLHEFELDRDRLHEIVTETVR